MTEASLGAFLLCALDAHEHDKETQVERTTKAQRDESLTLFALQTEV